MNSFMSEKCSQALAILWQQTNINELQNGYKYLMEAIKDGDIETYYFLGYYRKYQKKIKDLKRDKEVCLKYYLKGAEAGSARCILGLLRIGKYEQYKQKCKLKLQEAFDIVLDMALFDEPFSCYQIALAYYFGDVISYGLNEVPSHKDEAEKWFKRALKHNLIPAMNDLGSFYYYIKDYENAFKYFSMATENNSCDAMCNLAEMYENGQYVETDYTKATFYYQKAADLNYYLAQRKLGLCYLIGNGVKKDYKKSLYWYNLAAKQKDTVSMDNIAYCNYYGYGCEINYQKALEIFQSNAKKNDAYALYYLGVMYEEGNGVEKDYNKAIESYTKASELGYEEATKRLEELKE